jgi:uncharacterized membrane protein (UPF0127 family)
MGRIYNKTRAGVLATEFGLADTALARARGLMFRRGIRKPLLFVFDNGRERARASCAVHSLFVFFPFSAIFLNSEKRVVDVRVAGPFISLITPRKDSAYLIEGRPELAGKVRVGDVLEFMVR